MTERRVLADATRLAERLCRDVVEALSNAVRARGRALLAVSGGSTPRPLYERLGGDAAPKSLWEHTELYWADERYVPRSSPDSNFRLVADSLLVRGGPPPDHVHPVDTDPSSPDAAARQYEATLRDHLPGEGPGLDVALLGIGPDGHTASLFPGAPALEEERRWVVGVDRSPQPPTVPRVTMTVPFLNRSRRVFFLVSGAEKAEIVHRALEDPGRGADRLPAARIVGREATVWYLDRAAARALDLRGRSGEPG